MQASLTLPIPSVAPRRLILPLAGISGRVAVWSILTGIAQVLPLITVIALLPVLHRDPAAVEAASQRSISYFLHPGALALKALLIMPLLEEAFFRGLLLSYFRRAAPLWFAVFLPTLLFAVGHVGSGLSNAAFALVAGLYFSWLVLRSGSLLSSLLCHSATNLSALFVFGPILAAHGLTTPRTLLEPFSLGLLGGSVVVWLMGVRILDSEFKRRSSQSRLSVSDHG